MIRSRSLIAWLAAWLVLTTAHSAQAQSVSPSPTSTPVAGDGSTAAQWLIVLGALALLLLYLYLHAWRRDAMRLMGEVLVQTGTVPTTEQISGAVNLARGGIVEAGAESASLVIKGPDRAVLGQPSEPFTALVNDQPTDAEWRVISGRGAIEPNMGTHARLTPAAVGSIEVGAKVGEAEARLVSEAVAGSSAAGRVPVVGSGYGAFTIAILAITIAGALTAIGVLPSAALATLLGTVVSYFFVQRQAAGGDSTIETPTDSETRR